MIQLFERYGIESGLEAVHGEDPPEERITALFRRAFQELPAIIYLDDFEQNLERVAGGPPDAEDVFIVKRDSDAMPLVRGLLKALPWAEGKTSLIISSRYPFKLEHMGTDLPGANLFPIPLMSMREADLKKKIETLEHIPESEHRDLYLEAGKGNPRLLEWLDKIAAEEWRLRRTIVPWNSRKSSGNTCWLSRKGRFINCLTCWWREDLTCPHPMSWMMPN